MLIAFALTSCGTDVDVSASLIREGALLHPARLNISEKNALIRYVRNMLYSNFSEDIKSPAMPELIGYDKLYVTLWDNGEIRCRRIGKADREQAGWCKKDISSAVKRCVSDDRFGEKNKEKDMRSWDVEITYLYGRRKVDGGKDKLRAEFALGINGLEVENGDKRAIFKESDPIIKQYDFDKTIKKICEKAGLKSDCDQNKNTTFFLYDSISFLGDQAYKEPFDLYRQNIIFPVFGFGPNVLIDRLKVIKKYLIGNINPETGRLWYEYFPTEDKYDESGSSEIRFMATCWAMAALQNQLESDDLSPMINNMLDYYLKDMRCDVDKEFGDYCVIDTDGGKIASNAFILLALIEYPVYPNSEDIKKKLAAGLLRQQKENGAFLTRFNSGGERGKDYYPGEAKLALMRYHQETKDSKYMNAVQKAFPYYRKYWRGNKNAAFVSWNTQAYKILYDVTKSKMIASFIFEMNDWIVKNEQVHESLYKDEIGGMPKKSPRFSTSVYVQGINDAYSVAVAERDHKRTVRYRDSIKSGIRFILLSQYVYLNSYYLPNEERAYGGFRYSLTKNNMRIDFTQHAIFAILKALENGLYE